MSTDTRASVSQPRASPRLLALTLGLSLVPSALVMLDRWAVLLRSAGSADAPGCPWGLWCARYPPPYLLILLPIAALTITNVARFPGKAILSDPRQIVADINGAGVARARSRPCWTLILLGGSALVLALVYGRWRKEPPGWEYAVAYALFLLGWLLSDGLVISPRQWLASHGRAAAFALLVFSAAAAAARISFTHPFAGTALTLALVALALIKILHWRNTPLPGLWLATLALCLCGTYLTAWWFTAIGDEYSFYHIAAQLAARLDPRAIGKALFEAQGVYGTHPMFSSLLQAISLRVWGDSLFGWRFGGVLLVASAILLLMPFYRLLGRPALAIYAAFLLAASPYLMSFVKIGYNNLQAFFALALALAAAAWAIRSPTIATYALAGAAAGLSFYVYPVALLALPVPFLLLAFLGRARPRNKLIYWGGWLSVLLATALPIVLQPEFWATKVGGLWLNQPLLREAPMDALRHMTGNLGAAVLAPLFLADESHFVTVGYLDPLSAALGLIGVAVLVRRIEPRRAARFLVTSLAVLLLLVGALHDRPFPPTTRMFILLPILVVLPALGLSWLQSALTELGWPSPQVKRTEAAMLIGILVMALIQAYPLSRLRTAARYQSFQVLLVREADRLFHTGLEPAELVIVTQPERPLRASLLEILRLSGIALEPGQVREVPDTVDASELAQDPNALILVAPWTPQARQAKLESGLKASGRSPCRFRDSLGQVRLLLWAPPAWSEFCQQANLQAR